MEFINVFKFKLLLYIFFVNFFLTGILYQCIKWITLPLFKSYGFAADVTQLYTAVVFIPYSCKPIFGILSDSISIFGYNKKYWLLSIIILSVLFSFSLFSLKFAIIILTFIIYNFQISVTDLLTEATYTSIMKKNPETGSDIVLYTNVCKNIGQLLALAFLGPLVDKNYYWVLYIIMVLSSFSILFPTILNWLNETKINENYVKLNKDLLLKNKREFSLIFFTGIFSLLVSLISTFIPVYATLIISFFLLFFIILGSFFSFDVKTFYIIMYLIIVKISKPSLGSAMDYFYTANPTCLPDGPHFDFKYYITYTGVLGTIITLLSIILYKLFLSKKKFRYVLIITSILISLSGISDLLIVTRVNLKMGISDSAFYIFGEAIVEKTISTLYLICISTLISKTCKDKMESSTYAFLSSINEFSTFISKIEGIVIFNSAGIKTLVPCDFSNLWILILCCHIIPPIIIGIPSVFLIPNIYQNTYIDSEIDALDLIDMETDINEMEDMENIKMENEL